MKKLVLGSDEQLIKQCSKGNHEAFDMLFKKYSRPLTYFIFQIIRDHDRSQDIFQDTFIKVLERADQFNDSYRFSTWIYRIAMNLSINELRKRKRENGIRHFPGTTDNKTDPFDSFDSGNEKDPLEKAELKDLSSKVDCALRKLPDPKRIAFILKFHHNLSYEEIAGIMECSTGTVKSRIHYAVEQLQILVGE